MISNMLLQRLTDTTPPRSVNLRRTFPGVPIVLVRYTMYDVVHAGEAGSISGSHRSPHT